MKSVKLFWTKIALIITMILCISFMPIIIKNIISGNEYILYINDNNRENIIKKAKTDYGLVEIENQLKMATKIEYSVIDGKKICKIEYENGSVENLSYNRIVDINNFIKNEGYGKSEIYILYLSLDIIILATLIFLYKKINNEVKFINKFEEIDNEE